MFLLNNWIPFQGIADGLHVAINYLFYFYLSFSLNSLQFKTITISQKDKNQKYFIVLLRFFMYMCMDIELYVHVCIGGSSIHPRVARDAP